MAQRILWTLAVSVAPIADAGAQQYVFPATQQQQASLAKARAACLEGKGLHGQVTPRVADALPCR